MFCLCDLGDILVKMADSLVELPQGKSGMVPKIDPRLPFVDCRRGCDREIQQRSQELDLEPGAYRLVVCSIQIEALLTGGGLGQREKASLNCSHGNRALLELARILGVS